MRTRSLFVLWIVLVLLLASCQPGSPTPLAHSPENTTAPAGGADQPTPAAPPSGSPGGSEPAAPQGTQYATTQPEGRITWFKQSAKEPQNVSYCVEASTSETAWAQVGASLSVQAFDSSGVKLGESYENTGWLLPGQKTILCPLLLLQSTGKVDRLEVKIDPGILAALPGGSAQPFTAANPVFATLNTTPYAYVQVTNNLSQDVTELYVTTVAFDESGQQTGGSQEMIPFLAAGQSAVVQVRMEALTQAPARLEAYARLFSESKFTAQTGEITIEKSGAYAYSPSALRVFTVLQNNTNLAYENAHMLVSIYDAAGLPAGASTSYLPFLLPGGRVVIMNTLDILPGSVPARVEMQVAPDPQARFQLAGISANPLGAENAQYLPGVNESKVTALITNSAPVAIDSVGAIALLTDSTGQIVGGGQVTVNQVPASGKAQAEIPVEAQGDPVQVEVFPFVYSKGSLQSSPAAEAPTVSAGGSSFATTAVQGAGAPTAFQPATGSTQPAVIKRALAQFLTPSPSYYGALVEVANPNADFALKNIVLQVTAADSGGVSLASGETRISLLLPGQSTLFFAGAVTSSSTKTPAAKVDVTVKEGGAPLKSSIPSQALLVERVRFWPENGQVTAVVHNFSGYQLDLPQVTTVLYNSKDEPVAAQTNSVGIGFLAASDATAISQQFYDVDPDAVRAEVYVSPGGDFTAQAPSEDRQPLENNGAFGFRDQSGYMRILFYLSNLNKTHALAMLPYQVAAYNASGDVLGVSSSTLPVIFPGRFNAFVSSAFKIPPNETVDRMVVQTSAAIDDFNYPSLAAMGLDKSPFSTPDCKYDPSSPSAMCEVKNDSAKTFQSASLLAVAMDSGSHIVGFGDSSLASLAPGASQSQNIFMLMAKDFSGSPASVKLFAYLNSPTDIK